MHWQNVTIICRVRNMANSRLNKSIKNTIIGIIFTMLNLIFQFSVKSVFIKLLGETYNGVNGLFSSILQVLNLAELGFASAVAYSLYKPLNEGNEREVAAYMNYFARVYRVIALVVALAGALCIPILQFLINEDIAELPFTLNQLRLYFVFYLANTVFSYLLAYKRTIISADQKMYIISISDNIANILLNALQIILLLITHNYFAFLAVMVAKTIINNLVVHLIANKKYPYLFTYKKESLLPEQKKALYGNINALMLHKVGSVIIFGTISIVISAFVGAEENGIYSNYVQIINGVNLFINIVFNSIVASVGDLCVRASDEDKTRVFKRIDFLGKWLSVFCMTCYINMFNSFINSVWIRSDGVHSFEFAIVVAIAVSACTTYMRKTVLIFRDAMGLFKKDWYKPLIESAVGIALAIGLNFVAGVFGIVVGYTIAAVFIAVPIETYVLFKFGLHRKCLRYLIWQYVALAFAIALGIGVYYVCELFKLNGIIDFVVRTLISLIVPNIILLLVNIKNENLRYYINLLKNLTSKISNKFRGSKK